MRKDNIIENFHGIEVADPYRWLEHPNDPDTVKFIEEQNAFTREFLDGEARDKWVQRLTELWNYPKFSPPKEAGGRYFYQKNDGLQNQALIYIREGLEGEEQVLLDPNTLSEDGTVAVSIYTPSRDGRYLAYSLTSSGSDWQTVRVLDVATGQDLEDVIHWCRFTNLAWTLDNAGFFYTRFPDPATVDPEDQANYSKVYYHRLGTSQEADVLIYERPDAKELGFSAYVSEDGQFLGIIAWHGTDRRNGLYIRPLEGGEFTCLAEVGEAAFSPVGNVGTTLYVETNLDAPRGRIITMDLAKPERANWRQVVAEGEDVIDFSALSNNQLLLVYMHHAHHRVNLFSLTGEPLGDLELPSIGSVVGLEAKADQDELFISFTSYLEAAGVYRRQEGKLVEFAVPKLSVDTGQFETIQVFYQSKDGTQVPMFITAKAGLRLDGSNPTLLYGYGGFNVSMTPAFSPSTLAWMEAGGVYAVACLRGGSEYGEDWHQQGMLANKQNVFDDFISAAEWLITEGYTKTSRLGIMGGSNGGLLVGACMVQRPELFGAVVCRVPVIDMLRYHKFTVGRYWIPEYGNAETDPEQFKFMYAYSPLHSVKEGVRYPATMIMTADTDDRVVPAHALKFAATLLEMRAGDNPLVLRVEFKAGHGHGKPTAKLIDEAGDVWTFLEKVLK
jgi:prolyl oligopeptidase